MWHYQHPDFAVFLLGELQKQQQGSIFCDTLLQTDGVCVPAHSCVLAALSPALSRVLSTSPAPQAGQNRLLSLEAVGSCALLKLVKFLYTGEMEIKSQTEHEEVMAAAFRLGLKNLLEKKRVCVERGVEKVVRCWREIGVQTEDVSSQESEMVSEPLRIQSSTLPVQACGLLEADLSSLSLLDEASPAAGFNRTSNATVSSLAVVTEASVINHHKTKAKKRWKMAKRESQLKKITRQQMNVSGKNFQKLLEADEGQKSATVEQKEAKLDQLKVRIKLRRSGACWESNLLVSVQGESEKNPEEIKECALQTQSYPPSVLPGFGTLTPPTDLTISPSDSSTHASSDKCLRTPHHVSVSSPLEIPTLSSSPPQADDSDEHIAKMLDDMLMDLNILPLMPIDRNLDEQEQLGSLQDPKDQQRAADASAQGACLYLQSCEPEMKGSDVSKAAVPVGSPGQRDEDHSGIQNQSRSSTFMTKLPGQDVLNKDEYLSAGARNSTPSLVEDLFLTPKATAVPANLSPATGEMSSLVMTSILDNRPEFKLLRCLSPLESDKGDSDVPTQEPPHRQDLETQNLPLWLSESPLKLDFPLSSMIDSSHPHPQPDLIACQDRLCPDLTKKQELKTSFLQDDLTSGSSSNTMRKDAKDASEHPKQRKTRRRRLATQKSEVNGDTMFQNLENQDQVQQRTSNGDDPHCEDVKPSTSNARRVSARITKANRKATAGVKRKKEISSPTRKKMPLLNTDGEQHDVLPKPKVTGIVKRGRGRPPRSKKKAAVAHVCNSAEKLPTSGQDDCEVEKTKKDSDIEQSNNQNPNTQQEKDLTEMGEADVNSNFAATTLNAHLKHAAQAKGSSIIDQIFHQTLPSVESLACRSSLNIDLPLTSSMRDASFSLQKFQGGKSDKENSKLTMNSSEVLNKGICGKKKAETSMLMDENKNMEVSDYQIGSLLSKDGETATEENSSVLQNSDSQNMMGKDIHEQMTEISAPLTEEEDIMKVMMMPADDAGRAKSPTEKDCDVSTNELTVMEGIEINFCTNLDSTPAERLRDGQNLEDTVFNECSFEPTSDVNKDVQAAHGVNTQDVSCVADCVEKEEDLGRNKELQMIEEIMEGEETEVLGANELTEENALSSSDDRCWETTNGWDDNDEINEEGDQYSAGKIEEQTLLEEDELSEGHIASAGIADNASDGALTLRNTEEIISRDAPCAQTEVLLQSNYQSPRACSENISMVTSSSESGDEEDIEVDVVEESAEDPLGLLASRQFVTLAIECLMEQEDELNATEEEEVDVTGEETE